LGNLKEMVRLLLRQLEQEDAIEKVRQGLIGMEHSIERTEVLVEDLLDTSLIDTNMFLLQRERYNLVALCQNWLHQYVEGSSSSLTCSTTDRPVEVEVDSNRIFQALINLLSCARKYAPKSSPITITVETSGFEAILSVHSKGSCIPEGELSSICRQFSHTLEAQALHALPLDIFGHGIHAPSKEAAGAHGYRDPLEGTAISWSRLGLELGLYISQRIVERHGGQIQAQSMQGEGCIFRIILPRFLDPTMEAEDTSSEPYMHGSWTITP